MPVFDDDKTLEQFHVGTFGFTAQNVGELESSGYTLADIVVDVSGSTGGFLADMEKALLGAIVSLKGDPSQGIKPDPRADSMMLRVTTFSDRATEIMGYTLLTNVDVSKLQGCLKVGGMTALFDSCIGASEAAYHYAKTLRSEDYDVNGILIVITDGLNNAGRYSASHWNGSFSPSEVAYRDQVKAVATAMRLPLQQEAMESYVSVLIGVNCAECKTELEWFKSDAGFTAKDLIALTDASPATIQKIGGFVSQSVSSQSQARGTGGPSQSIASTI